MWRGPRVVLHCAQSWLEHVAADDGDGRCRAMADACLRLHGAAAAEAAVHALEGAAGVAGGPWPGGTAQRALGSGASGLGQLVDGPLGMVRDAVVLLPHHVQDDKAPIISLVRS